MKTYFETPAVPALQRFSLNGATMGTRYTAVFYAPAAADTATIGESLFAAVDMVDRQMSTWKPDSDLCRLNAGPIDAWLPIPAELAQVLAAGLQVGIDSRGAFDFSVGELVDAWGFGPSQRHPADLPHLQPDAVQRPGSAALEIDLARCAARKRAPISIDLSGIAKGYGVDKLAETLDGAGIANYLVGIDGEMRARGCKPGGQAWTVALEKPSYGIRELAGAMELMDTAIASSGDYRHWVDIAGSRYSHTIDPATQQPVANRVAGVTVLGDTCMLADAWATALMVLGEHDGVRLALEQGMDALFTVREGERLKEIWVSEGAQSVAFR